VLESFSAPADLGTLYHWVRTSSDAPVHPPKPPPTAFERQRLLPFHMKGIVALVAATAVTAAHAGGHGAGGGESAHRHRPLAVAAFAPGGRPDLYVRAHARSELPRRRRPLTASSLLQDAAAAATAGEVMVASPSLAVDGASHPALATFAGGCFWGLQLALDREPGVLETVVGYTQGGTAFPTYADIGDHTEAVLVAFDEDVVGFSRLASLFFDVVGDPTQLNRVGSDRGTQYRTGMYYTSPAQESEARAAFDLEAAAWRTSGRKVMTEVLPAQVFYPAEAEHQKYLENGGRFGRAQDPAKGCRDPIRCYG